jgi:hypothetical protein
MVGYLDPVMPHRYTWQEGVDQFHADEQISTPASAGNVIWGLGDHLGTLRDIADLSGSAVSITNHRDYDCSGKSDLANQIDGNIAGLLMILRYIHPQPIIGHQLNHDLSRLQTCSKFSSWTDSWMPALKSYILNHRTTISTLEMESDYLVKWISSKPPGQYWAKHSADILFDGDFYADGTPSNSNIADFLLSTSHIEYLIKADTDGRTYSIGFKYAITDWIDAKTTAEDPNYAAAVSQYFAAQ